MKDKIVVLDTNVLLHDPEAPHRFGDLRVVIPMQVVEEIDRFKKDHSEKAFFRVIFLEAIDFFNHLHGDHNP